MKNLNQTEPIQLSYYELYLTKYLRDFHPEKAFDTTFIKQRSDSAAITFEESRLQGHTVDQAQELAIKELMQGLHFSKQQIITEIIENEFSVEIPETKISAFLDSIKSELDDLFSKYMLSDDFEASPEYDTLYSEITGAITIYLENHGIQ